MCNQIFIKSFLSIKSLITLSLFIAPHISFTQSIADFEKLPLKSNEFLDGSDGKGGFSSGSFYFPNRYNSQFKSFLGWAISATTDTITKGYTNQFSSISGTGNQRSKTYALAYAPGETFVIVAEKFRNIPLHGLYVNNGTYGYMSMKNGDDFAKKFGGVNGNDPDFFQVTFYGYQNGAKKSDSVVFLLSDFRFEDASDDYILKDWAFVDLSKLGSVDSFSFVLNSSDEGAFGMNTPAYLFIDDLSLDSTNSIYERVTEKHIKCYPNPTQNRLYLSTNSLTPVDVFNSQGRLVLRGEASHKQAISLSKLPKGIYFVQTPLGQSQLVLMP